MRPALVLSLALAFVACGDDGDNPPDNETPAEARLIDTAVEDNAKAGVPILAEVEALVPFLGNPGAPGAEGLTLTPTGAPNTWAFAAPLDRDGDGTPDANVSGTATLSGDPFGGDDDLSGTVTFTATGATGRTIAGSFTFTQTDDALQVHGSAAVSGTVSGLGAAVDIPASSPITIRRATGSGSAQPNVCGYSLTGDAIVTAGGGSAGTLSFIWRFSGGSRSIAVVDRSYTSSDGETTPLADKTLTLACGGTGASIDDWDGVFLQNWVCLPPEFGTEELTITVADGNTVEVVDEDPPGSGDFNTFEASALPGNPYVLTGFFIGGPPGSTYREDFTWTMARDRNHFSKSSRYEYLEGPNAGRGGRCGGRAERD